MKTSRYEYAAGDQANAGYEHQRYLWEEYEQYVRETPMSDRERGMLRKWVSEGRSVYDEPGSAYLCDRFPPRTFLEAYREEQEIEQHMRGMTNEEKIVYLKGLMGYTEPTQREIMLEEAKNSTPAVIQRRVVHLERELFYLWEFVWREGLGEEAREFVDDHRNEPIPFEW